MSKKLGKAWRGTVSVYKQSRNARKGRPDYKRFSGFNVPAQPDGMPQGRCFGASRGMKLEGCRCGKHNKK